MKKIKLDYHELLDAISYNLNNCGAYIRIEEMFANHLGIAGVDLNKINLYHVFDLAVVQMEEDFLDTLEELFNNDYYNKDKDGNQIYQLELSNDY